MNVITGDLPFPRSSTQTLAGEDHTLVEFGSTTGAGCDQTHSGRAAPPPGS